MHSNSKRYIFLQMIRASLFVVFLCLFLFFPIKADASYFTHKHDAGCYQKVIVNCKHDTCVRDTVMERHCPHCGKMTSCTLHFTFDCCSQHILPDRQTDISTDCNECGGHVGDIPGWVPGHTYEVTNCVCPLEDGTQMAEVHFTPSTSEWTNGGVVLNADLAVLNAAFQASDSPFSYDGGSSYTAESSLTVTENGTYNVTARNAVGETAGTSVTVQNIDKTAPSIVSIQKNTENWSIDGVDVTVDASDDLSGLAEQAYSFDGGATFNDSGSKRIKVNGTIGIVVRDCAGNQTASSITITNVGAPPATPTPEKPSAATVPEVTNGDKVTADTQQSGQNIVPSISTSPTPEKRGGNHTQQDKTNTNQTQSTLSCGENSISKNQIGNAGTDVSHNDTSNNALRFIQLTDVTGKEKTVTTGNRTKKATPEIIEIEDVPTTDTMTGRNDNQIGIVIGTRFIPLFSTTGGVILIGTVITLIGIITLFSLNFIMMNKDGRQRLLTTGGCSLQKGKVVIVIPNGRIAPNRKYRVVFGVFGRMISKGKPVFVQEKGNSRVMAADSNQNFYS